MKTAILLLVGAAVIGPIDAKPVRQEGCVIREYPLDECRRPESLPALCVRAMKEIGARRGHFSRDLSSWPIRPDMFIPSERGPEWALGEDRVRCIPAPGGYRR